MSKTSEIIKASICAVAALIASALLAAADPAVIYDLGGKFDKSFNENAYIGAERWKAETGGSYRDIELQSQAQREQAMQTLAESGHNPIVMTGFAFAIALAEIAPDYPDTKFVIIDDAVDLPNVRSVLFKEHEGSYLVGLLAGMATNSGIVGFVGGMDVPLIRKVACGYAQGVLDANPQIKVVRNMTGNTPAAWNDPVKGAEIAKAQVGQGADVIFQGAGGTGLGVLQAAADEGILGIGSDANQNYLHPGSVLTSMIKRVDHSVFKAFSEGADLETGVFRIGLAENAVGYTLDEFNADLITDEMIEAVEDARGRIVNGAAEIHDYSIDETCPYW